MGGEDWSKSKWRLLHFPAGRLQVGLRMLGQQGDGLTECYFRFCLDLKCGFFKKFFKNFFITFYFMCLFVT